MSCNSDIEANKLFASLSSSGPSVPDVDLTSTDFLYEVDVNDSLQTNSDPITLDDLTETTLDGEGVFDRLMKSVDLHIQREFKDNRITGDQYAKVYNDLVGGVLSTATQFTLSKDKAYWDTLAAQMQARIVDIQTKQALVELSRARIEAGKLVYEMHQSEAEYALTKAQIANADAQYCLTKKQETLLDEQVEKERAQTIDTRTDGTKVSGLIGKQKESMVLDIDTKTYALGNTLPMQLALISEQREAERAKTLDTRTDGGVVVGSVGKQKDLYTQQIDSFIKDAKYKTAKMYLDGWITQKTLDEGLLAPNELTNTNVDAVLASLRGTNNLT